MRSELISQIDDAARVIEHFSAALRADQRAHLALVLSHRCG